MPWSAANRRIAASPARESFTRIGPQCTIREGATVHRGTDPGTTTIVGARCLLMTNSHVGHNCELADDVILVSGSLLGGYVQIGAARDDLRQRGHSPVRARRRTGARWHPRPRITQDVPPLFLTDQAGAVIGENRVGMTRRRLVARRAPRDQVGVPHDLSRRFRSQRGDRLPGRRGHDARSPPPSGVHGRRFPPGRCHAIAPFRPRSIAVVLAPCRRIDAEKGSIAGVFGRFRSRLYPPARPPATIERDKSSEGDARCFAGMTRPRS